MNDQLLKEIIEKLNKIESDVQELKSDIQELKSDSSMIKQAVLETADRVKHIESRLESHERILDLLSRRSLEHEAALKSIK